MSQNELIKELAWKSYKNCHTAEAQTRLMNEHGERWFRERGILYHGRIVEEVFKLLEEEGYMVVRGGFDLARPGSEQSVEQNFDDLC